MVLVELRFKVHRGLIAEGTVEPLPVVKDPDPFEDRRAGLGARGKLTPMHQFAFQTAPEAFHHGVVIAVALAAHAWHHARRGETLAEASLAYCTPRSE